MLENHSQRLLRLENTLNVRDLGGYPATNGKKFRWRKFIRADNLFNLGQADRQFLLDYPVSLIIDLRTSREVNESPNCLASSKNVSYLHLPLYDGAELEARFDVWQSLAETNKLVLEICRGQIKTIFEAIINCEESGAILFHCASGKDRTGLIAGMLLDLAGVPPELIAEDYSLSAGYLESRITNWRKYALANNRDMVLFELVVGSRPQDMLDTLEHIENVYGGTWRYLTEVCGIPPQPLEKLRSSLLE